MQPPLVILEVFVVKSWMCLVLSLVFSGFDKFAFSYIWTFDICWAIHWYGKNSINSHKEERLLSSCLDIGFTPQRRRIMNQLPKSLISSSHVAVYEIVLEIFSSQVSLVAVYCRTDSFHGNLLMSLHHQELQCGPIQDLLDDSEEIRCALLSLLPFLLHTGTFQGLGIGWVQNNYVPLNIKVFFCFDAIFSFEMSWLWLRALRSGGHQFSKCLLLMLPCLKM